MDYFDAVIMNNNGASYGATVQQDRKKCLRGSLCFWHTHPVDVFRFCFHILSVGIHATRRCPSHPSLDIDRAPRGMMYSRVCSSEHYSKPPGLIHVVSAKPPSLRVASLLPGVVSMVCFLTSSRSRSSIWMMASLRSTSRSWFCDRISMSFRRLSTCIAQKTARILKWHASPVYTIRAWSK